MTNEVELSEAGFIAVLNSVPSRPDTHITAKEPYSYQSQDEVDPVTKPNGHERTSEVNILFKTLRREVTKIRYTKVYGARRSKLSVPILPLTMQLLSKVVALQRNGCRHDVMTLSASPRINIQKMAFMSSILPKTPLSSVNFSKLANQMSKLIRLPLIATQ
ncbi:727_t:CDS:2, partial [Acaulospora colombiana]